LDVVSQESRGGCKFKNDNQVGWFLETGIEEETKCQRRNLGEKSSAIQIDNLIDS